MNRSLKIAVYLLLLSLTSSLFAQGNLSGIVTDNEGNPLAGANVYLSGTELGSATDENGKYTIVNANTGNYTLVVSYLGYSELKLILLTEF